jgi:hypothetical protein
VPLSRTQRQLTAAPCASRRQGAAATHPAQCQRRAPSCTTHLASPRHRPGMLAVLAAHTAELVGAASVPALASLRLRCCGRRCGDARAQGGVPHRAAPCTSGATAAGGGHGASVHGDAAPAARSYAAAAAAGTPLALRSGAAQPQRREALRPRCSSSCAALAAPSQDAPRRQGVAAASPPARPPARPPAVQHTNTRRCSSSSAASQLRRAGAGTGGQIAAELQLQPQPL